MKRIIFLLSIMFAYGMAHAQTTGYLRNDTIKLTNAAKNTTLVIESASRGHNWYLKDIGNGRTLFVEATIGDVSHLQDSLNKKASLTEGNDFTGDQNIIGKLSSVKTMPINSYWGNSSQFLLTRHEAINLTLQSADPAGGGAGIYWIDSSSIVNDRVFGIANANSKLSVVAVNDAGNVTDTMTSVNRSGDLYVKRNIYQNGNQVANENSVVQKIANIEDMQAYTGASSIFAVSDSLRGGVFHKSNTSPYPVDNGIVFASNDGKYLIRDLSNTTGVNIQWYGAKADWLKSGRAITKTGTDSRAAILAAMNAAYKRAVSVYIPGKYPYSFGSSDRIKVGQGTIIKGESGFLPWQSTSVGDTVKFAPLSSILFYNHTDCVTTDEAGSFRPQGFNLKDFLVIGMYSGSASDTTAGLKLYSNSHGNPGVNTLDGFHVSDCGTAFDLKKANDTQFFLAGAENCRVGWRGGLNSTHISLSEGAFLDTIGIIKGSLHNISNNQFSACKSGLFADSLSTSIIATNHFYGIGSDGLVFRAACSSNMITGNQMFSPERYAIRFKSAGINNIVSGNTISGSAYPSVYASNTSKLTIMGNVLSSPTTSSIIAFKLDTCTNYILSNNTIGDYAYNKQLDATGSSQTNIDNFNNIKRRGTTSDTPVDIAYNAGTSNTAPSLLGNNVTIRSLNGNVYNGSSETNVIKLVERTNEGQSGSALGTAFDFMGVRNGTTSVTNFATFDGNGLSLMGATNSVALYPGVSSGADILRAYPLRTDKQFLTDYFTSGTGIGSATRWFNKSDLTNNSSFKISAAADTAFINYQDIGTGTTNPIRNVSLNGGAFGSALSSWNFGNVAVRLSKMGLYQSINSAYARLQLTGLITNGGQGVDLIPNGSSAQTDIRLMNQGNTSSFGSFKIAVDADTARMLVQNGGTPTSAMTSVSLLPGALGTGITDWQWGPTNVRVRNLYFDVSGSSTGSIIFKASTGKLTSLGIGTPGYYLRVNSAGTLPEYTNKLTGIITPTTVFQTPTGNSVTDSVVTKDFSTGQLHAVPANLFIKTSITAGGDLSGTYSNPRVNTINGITKSYYDVTSSIQTQLNSKASTDYADAAAANTNIFNNPVLFSSSITAGSIVVLKDYTVATLPASPSVGAVAYVTDGLSPSYLSPITGGGSVRTPVFYNGSTWIAH